MRTAPPAVKYRSVAASLKQTLFIVDMDPENMLR